MLSILFLKMLLILLKIVEQKIKNGSAGKLAGMVIAIKDVLAIEDKPLTCSSKILENFQSLYTATAVQKLNRRRCNNNWQNQL